MDFKVVHLSGWMYRFSVFSKDVGLMIYKFGSLKCKSFDVFFFLWGNGGPNWERDHARWIQECEVEWTVSRSRSSLRRSFADVVCSREPPFKSVFKILQFPHSYFATNFASSGSSSSRVHRVHLVHRQDSNFKSFNGDASQSCFRCLVRDHRVVNCQSNIRCRICHRLGHFSKTCSFFSGPGVPPALESRPPKGPVKVQLPKDKLVWRLRVPGHRP